MDSTNSLSQSILQSSESSTTISSSNDNGFFDSFKNINVTTWILVILILAFLGFNIFVYLAKGTQDITTFFAPLLQKIFGAGIATTGQVVDVSAEGAKAVVGGTSGAIQTGLTSVQNITPNTAKSSIPNENINQQNKPDTIQKSSLNQALNSAQSNDSIRQEQEQNYQADNASSSIQGGGKAGWCFIGEDRGFRTCAEIGIDDSCMSGEIFPNQEICMNPNLRI
jgi:hypothetical protein